MSESWSDHRYLTPEEASAAQRDIQVLKARLSERIMGQEKLIELIIIGIMARGHLLLEGLPGLGKTELVKTLAAALELGVKRVQFTPDLLPGDITGSPIIQDVGGERHFVFCPGPLFTNLLLADEINRASPKTQAALLEAMQERAVTVHGTTHPLPQPFFVLATQNPIELEGTYQLPEALLDRFLFKLKVEQPSVETLESIVLRLHRGAGGSPPSAEVCFSAARLNEILDQVTRIYLPPSVAAYIARLVQATHPGSGGTRDGIRCGASPRAAIALAAAACARALASGRPHTSFDDVKEVARPVLAHRLILTYQLHLQGITAEQIIDEIIAKLPVLTKSLPTVVEAGPR